jgi:Fic family protein
MMADFVHSNISLPQPKFESKLTDLVIELDHLRKKRLGGTTHPRVFFQLKSIFQTLESIGSARIEGNNTTIAEFIETKLENRKYINEQIQEIRNIEECINFIEANSDDIQLGRVFISDLHKMLVKGLTAPPQGEGDKTPGQYRNYGVEIKGANHKPPGTQQQIEGYMQELFDFLNEPHSPKYDLLKLAIAHHRFMWIHPFGNGNGRVGRLLTYALLVKAGFNVHIGRILNPTAVFCINRDEYYKCLSSADSGHEDDLINWCTYVLEGLKSEIDKIDMLLNYDFLKEAILLPALEHASKMKYVDSNEYKILKVTVEKQIVQNSDIQDVLKNKHMTSISRYIRALKEKRMLESEADSARKYHISFTNNFLMRSVIMSLEEAGFIPMKLDE